MFYIIVRIFYVGEDETHSVEIKKDLRDATQRFYNIVAADLANKDVTYQYASLTDKYGYQVNGIQPVVYDHNPNDPKE